MIRSLSEGDSEDIPEPLLPFISHLDIDMSSRRAVQVQKAVSAKKIPFRLTEYLRNVLKKSSKTRFNKDENDVCNLRPDYLLACSDCGSTSWCDEEQSTDSIIITCNQVLKAQGNNYPLIYNFTLLRHCFDDISV